MHVCMCNSDTVRGDELSHYSMCQPTSGLYTQDVYLQYFSLSLFCSLWLHQQILSLRLMHIIGLAWIDCGYTSLTKRASKQRSLQNGTMNWCHYSLICSRISSAVRKRESLHLLSDFNHDNKAQQLEKFDSPLIPVLYFFIHLHITSKVELFYIFIRWCLKRWKMIKIEKREKEKQQRPRSDSDHWCCSSYSTP